MTPVSLNLPGPTTQHQSQLFISPNNHDSTLSCCSLFHVLDQSQTKDIRDLRHGDQEDGKFEFHGGSSDNQQVCNASSVQPKAVMADEISSTCDHHNLSFYKIENQENRRGTYEYEKWLSSNVRLTRKMMSPPSTDSDLATKKTLNIIRVCADCNTTSTPLWRSGPNGPKSLCNACGIRQRKARRAMAEAAANGFSPSSSMDAKTRRVHHHHKEKKCRTNHFARFKNKSKAATSAAAVRGTLSEEQKVRIDLKDFAISLRDGSALKQVFPMDEVTHAALLLMNLSTGFLYF